MSTQSRVYIIGDREKGIVLLMLDPLRVAFISKQEIDNYAKTTNYKLEEIMGQVAKAAMYLIIHSDLDDRPADLLTNAEAFGDAVEKGMTMSQAEFCFIGDVATADWDTFRRNCIPIREAVNILGGLDGSPDGQVLMARLEDA
ncbi:hypothetical protein [Mesorhizobium sp. ES1-6]|uniref:hypothetical protein n=1 Tax=Mesorhizobium sp. ES1-6 TaxID=2876626 RepID=UPI001CCC8CF6|nr:hypothetical protein [Mesorhizobium sp. ES1-6]MBZ9801077.1 hypothetical protein [Mesorhizobium sp. ES1-6]